MSNIEQDKIKALFKHPTERTERQPDCPDDYQLASYMEGGLSERDHGRFEAHLADCAYCLERVGALGRAGEAPYEDAVAEAVQKHPRKTLLSQRSTRWATAAILVIAVGFIAGRQSPDRMAPVPNGPEGQSAATERFVERTSPVPEILSPREGGLVDPRSFVFRWKEVPDSLFYDIRIVTDDGEQIVSQRVWDTHWSLPGEIELRADVEYFVRVDAFVSEGKAVSYEHTVFRTAID